MAYQMNKQREAHMSGKEGEGEGRHKKGGHPHIFIHSHAGGHTVHIMHPDGRHEKHEHPHGDAEGIAQHVHTHLGAGGHSGQDHGVGDASGDELAGLGV
jgi:hypothetical protein